ncbi:MAG: branched-chain amino acid aminotransferase [Bacteroidetes bacterium]|nr:MAG: branched-chain amino acid aminotransferase [Bacteroidota bacterium]
MTYYNENTTVFFNDKFCPADDARVSVYAQSLHYGYAVFEGIRAYKTPSGVQIFKAKEHFERMKYSCELMDIPLNYTVEELTRLSYLVLEKNGLDDAYLRPLAFAGDPNMTLVAPAIGHLVISAWAWPKYLGDRLLRLAVSPYQRPNPKAVPMACKASGQYVNSTLASTEARKRGFDEALLLDMNGFVAEGPGANFFFEKDGTLFTPPAGNIFPGITRSTVIGIARESGISVEEKYFRPGALAGADGAFFTGTAAEIAGIASVDDMQFRKPFSETHGAFLAQAYHALVTGKHEVESYY